jgi:hypothetical protein
MTTKYTVELRNSNGVVFHCNSKKEAWDIEQSIIAKGYECVVYPSEPEEFVNNNKGKDMCQECGENVAEEDMFICTDCFNSKLERDE